MSYTVRLRPAILSDCPHMTLESRQLQAAYDPNRSSFTPTDTFAYILEHRNSRRAVVESKPPTPPSHSIAQAKLDLALVQAERARQQAKRIADMEAELIAYAKTGEMKADDADP